jgi:hypothetical protein
MMPEVEKLPAPLLPLPEMRLRLSGVVPPMHVNNYQLPP